MLSCSIVIVYYIKSGHTNTNEAWGINDSIARILKVCGLKQTNHPADEEQVYIF